ncbi:hypothetical protein Q4540_19810 [Pseudoalteromonas carrageenovora]|uniref:hypothetical protein n=1 Tax=Pseudoalteromonas carrageenovora TaxID=227 RepID=UPI0026E133C6|nr:hypothetical protein [Pseudoalteromonas carrageenovora]MDO6650732.1 hypothetical protein [Pseudoalteromonas carrageenovora]
MIDAILYKDIVKAVNNQFSDKPKRIAFFDGVGPASSKAMADVNAKIKKKSLVAVLFCNPNSQFCKDEILESLSYFHHRSKEHIDIFCCGYGAYWPENKYLDLKTVTRIDGVEWSYSDHSFVAALEDFESKTKWRYSGENELLLLDVSPSVEPDELNINSALVCNLEQMKKDGAFSSVRALFESIIRYSANNGEGDAWGFSDQKGIEVASSFLKDSILGLLPKTLQSSYRKAENYAIKQI